MRPCLSKQLFKTVAVKGGSLTGDYVRDIFRTASLHQGYFCVTKTGSRAGRQEIRPAGGGGGGRGSDPHTLWKITSGYSFPKKHC